MLASSQIWKIHSLMATLRSCAWYATDVGEIYFIIFSPWATSTKTIFRLGLEYVVATVILHPFHNLQLRHRVNTYTDLISYWCRNTDAINREDYAIWNVMWNRKAETGKQACRLLMSAAVKTTFSGAPHACINPSFPTTISTGWHQRWFIAHL